MTQQYRYHHLGVPTDEVRPNERYSEYFKMYTSDHEGEFRIQFHRFESESPLHPLIQKHPHIALQVENLLEALEGKLILLGPFEPIAGYRVAIINDGGMPVELIETELTAEELWHTARKQEDLRTDGLKVVSQTCNKHDFT